MSILRRNGDRRACGSARHDAKQLKALASGRWRQILSALASIDEALLDGKHHGCPKCGGKDRFRAFDDFAETGGVICNQCFGTKNGDGLAALQWINGWSFGKTCKQLGRYLGLENGHHDDGKAPKPKQVFATIDAALEAYDRRIDGKRVGSGATLTPPANQCSWSHGGTCAMARRHSARSAGKGACGFKATRRNRGRSYNLAEVVTADTVDLFEGEKCCDAAASIGLVATTTAHGSKSPQNTNFAPLAGKTVRVYTDNDDAGRKYIDRVVAKLLELRPLPIVKRITLPGLRPNGDIVDWFDACDGAEPDALVAQLEELADAAEVEPQRETASATNSTAPFQFEWLTSAELADCNEQVEYLVAKVVTKAQGGIISGAFKTLKTAVAADLFISLATGAQFLGLFGVPTALPCGLMSAEIGTPGLRERAGEVAEAKGFDLRDVPMYWSINCPNVAHLEHLDALERFIEDRQLAMLGIDPSYLAFCEVGDKASNYIAMGRLLLGLTRTIDKSGCSIILLNHNRHGRGARGQFDPPELGEISYAGFAEWARFWLLLGARQEWNEEVGKHWLWLRTGGSAGHAGLHHLDVVEGKRTDPGGRRWQVNVLNAAEGRKQNEARKEQLKEQKRREKLDADKAEILSAYARRRGGETKGAIRDMLNMAGRQFAPAHAELIQDGELMFAWSIRGATDPTRGINSSRKMMSRFALGRTWTQHSDNSVRLPANALGHTPYL